MVWRDLAEAGAQIRGPRRHAFQRAGLGEIFAVEADHGGARGLFALAHHRGLAAPAFAPGCFHLLLSAGSLPPASTKTRAAGEPDVGAARGNYVAVLIDLAGEQLGVESGMQHDAGLGAAGFATAG